MLLLKPQIDLPSYFGAAMRHDCVAGLAISRNFFVHVSWILEQWGLFSRGWVSLTTFRAFWIHILPLSTVDRKSKYRFIFSKIDSKFDILAKIMATKTHKWQVGKSVVNRLGPINTLKNCVNDHTCCLEDTFVHPPTNNCWWCFIVQGSIIF